MEKSLMKKVHYEVVASVIIKDDLIFCCKRGNKKRMRL